MKHFGKGEVKEFQLYPLTSETGFYNMCWGRCRGVWVKKRMCNL